MKSGIGFLAFRLCRWASVLLIILLSLLVVSCDLWNKDMLGYLKYWSETVQLGKVEVSDATIQKNDAGADTIPVAATPTIAVYVVNPQGYGLLAEIGDSSSVDKSVRVSDSAVQSKAQVVAHEPTLLKVQLGSADGSLEHTEFRVDFEAIRKDTMQSSGQVMGVTLRYNTPPVAPTPVVWSYGSSQHEVVKDGETWEADRNGTLYWAYDDSITEETDPNCAKWFSINGTRHPVAECKVPDVQVDGLSVFQFKTNYGSTSVAAVDSEGVSSPAVASGQAVPPATYVIKYDGNGADGGTAPTSQNKTQYTDITLATNSGGLTRIGYRFTGWNTAKDGTGTTYSAGAAYSADESVTLYAQWEAVDAVVLTPESGAVSHGATVTLTPPKSDATIYYQIGGADETAGTPGQTVTVTLYNASHSPSSATGVVAKIPEGGEVTITAYAKYADGTKSEVTTGDYRLNQYTVRYEGNGNGDAVGNVPAPQTFYSGGSVAIGGGANRPERIGYRFTGWNTDPDGAGTTYSAGAAYSADESVTLYAQWEAVDAVVLTPEFGAVNHGATVTLTPPKSDATIYYQIGGADEEAGAPGQPVTVTLHNASHSPSSATGVAAGIPEGGSVTLTAHAVYADGTKSEVTTGDYRLNQYTVGYEGNGNGDAVGNVPAPQTFYSGGSVAIGGVVNRPERIGYRFTGWNTAPDGNGTTYFAGATYSADESVTLYAQWEAVDAVTFSRDGAVNSGDTVQLTPPKSDATIHYQINGTGETAGAKGQPVTVTLYNASNPPQNTTGEAAGIPEGGSVTITAYARYADGTQSKETTGTYSLKRYTVLYDGGNKTGGDEPDEQTFYSGGSVTVQGKSDLTKTGYTFAGWNTKAGGTGTPYREGDSYTDDASVTLTAQWDPNTYTVRFYPNGGSYTAAYHTQKFTYDDKENLDGSIFKAPVDSEFVGWKGDDGNVYTDKEEVNNLTTESDGTVILRAQWGCTLKDSAQEPSGYTSPHAPPPTGSLRYGEFGYWPQTVKADDVTVYTKLSKSMGMFTYYLGSDGNWYVEAKENALKENALGNDIEYRYSNGEQVGQGGTTTKWFKVEPIVWRVLTENYIDADGKSTGNALLLAESILTGGIKWADSKNDYMESNIRKWLNGNSGTGENSDYSGTPGFLQTAFTADAQSLIAETEVDNSAASTNPASNPNLWSGGNNPYACGNTTDKIFLLSQKEATTSEYGFAEYNVYVGDNNGTTTSTRIRVTTDYAKATGANQSFMAGPGGLWWLRSPNFDEDYIAHDIDDYGDAYYGNFVYNAYGGVVPALSISLGGN